MSLRFLAYCLLSTFAVTAANSAQEKPSLLASPIEDFEFTGSAQDAFVRIALMVRPQGAIGFQKIDGRGPNVTLSVKRATISELLRRICAQDPRFAVVATADPRVVNVLAKDKERRGLLNQHLGKFDFAVDDWPQNWFLHVPESSTEITDYLSRQYGPTTPPRSDLGTPGSDLSSDVNPPHVELHLENVTVREVLNDLSSKSIDLAAGTGAFIPKGVQLYPVGWQYSVPGPARASLTAWMRSAFSAFPPY